MPYDELLGWFSYFRKYPIEWRDDERAYKLLQVQGYKGKPGEAFHSLGVIHSKPQSESLQIKGTLMGHFIAGAKGGKKIGFEETV
jgi:hypothetical protein